jgi:hypothetical protein
MCDESLREQVGADGQQLVSKGSSMRKQKGNANGRMSGSCGPPEAAATGGGIN